MYLALVSLLSIKLASIIEGGLIIGSCLELSNSPITSKCAENAAQKEKNIRTRDSFIMRLKDILQPYYGILLIIPKLFAGIVLMLDMPSGQNMKYTMPTHFEE